MLQDVKTGENGRSGEKNARFSGNPVFISVWFCSAGANEPEQLR